MFPIEEFKKLRTPFYYYDTSLLRQTLKEIRINPPPNLHVHYAIKACANPKVLSIIAQEGFGADCVSGGEIQAALNAGFPADKIVYAGVGKSDWEIDLGLETGIFSFNVESIPELEIINHLAVLKGKKARVAFRINPNVGAHTHANITTGLAENKFGINYELLEETINSIKILKNVELIGLHFHIGSQILEMDDFATLCNRINEIQDNLDVTRIEKVIKKDFQIENEFLKVTFKHPQELAKNRDHEAHKNSYTSQCHDMFEKRNETLLPTNK